MALGLLPRPFLVDVNGSPRVGAKLYVYQSGTTTPITVYTTSAYSVAHDSPILSTGSGLLPAFYVDESVNATYKVVLTDSSDVAIYTEDNIPATGITQANVGLALYPRTDDETSAGVTPASYAYPPGNVLRYGADPAESTDSTAAFTSALSCNTEVWAPSGNYLVNGSIEVTSGKRLLLDKGALLRRKSSETMNTDPVVYVLGVASELRGGGIETQNASPGGVVVLGHKNATEDRDAWWWRFTDCDIGCQTNSGDIGIYVPSGQVDYPLRANYFGTIQNINISGGDIQLYLPELANAHNISNIQFWGGKTVGLRLRGAYGNNISNLFFHASAADGYIAIELQDEVDSGGQHHSIFNQITNWVTETANPNDRSVVVEANCSLNTIIGGSNVLGGYTLGSAGNLVIINGALMTATGITSSGAVQATTTVTGPTGLLFGTSGKLRQVTASVASGSAQPITPASFLEAGTSYMALVQITDSTNGNLTRADLLLLNIRANTHSPSTVTVVDDAFADSTNDGEPTAVTYALSFSDGATVPRLTANITRTGGAGTMNVSVELLNG